MKPNASLKRCLRRQSQDALCRTLGALRNQSGMIRAKCPSISALRASLKGLAAAGRDIETVTVHTDGRIEFTLVKLPELNALDIWRQGRTGEKS